MRIPHTNAFTINRLGADFFPLSLRVSQNENGITAFFCAQNVLDICPEIEAHALDNLILFGIDQYSQYDEKEERPFSLQQLAENAQIPHTAIDSGTLILSKEALNPLLATFSHNNLYAIDIGNPWDENQVIGQVIAFQQHNWQSPELLLPKLPLSQLLILSHDDCYLTVQTHNMALIQQIFSKMLQTYVGTVLMESVETFVDVAEISECVLDSFWGENVGLTILRSATQADEAGLKIGVAKKAFNFRENAEYPPEFWLRYETHHQQWSVVQ